jgi:hypothetical protein
MKTLIGFEEMGDRFPENPHPGAGKSAISFKSIS